MKPSSFALVRMKSWLALEQFAASDAEDEGARWGDGDGDASRKYALETRLRKMRALPKGSRYAKQQCELIEKALDILARGKRRGARSAEEEDELAGLLKAVKL